MKSVPISVPTLTSRHRLSLLLFVVTALFGWNTAFAQDGSIVGTVKDARSGETLPGANVVIVGTTRGAMTGIDGDYHIQNVPAGTYTVRASYVGYDALEVPNVQVSAGRNTQLDIVLTAAPIGLNEVVVVGYGEQRKVNVTGSVEMVTAEDLQGRALPNTSSGLQGLMPGVTVESNTSQPGASNSIRIRGIGTLGNSNPLVLIDGLEGTLDIINPEDVASVSVLKDAAASAIYGARGANGVILITTKQGIKSEQVKVSYTGTFSSQMPTALPKFLGSPEYMELLNESQRNVGKAVTYTDEQIQKTRDGSDPDYYANTNWIDAIYRDSAPQQNHNVSVTGGTPNASYFMSYGYFGQEGIVTGNNYGAQRHNLRLRLDTKVLKIVDLNGIFGYIQRNNYEPSWGTSSTGGVIYGAHRISPLTPLRFTNGQWGYGGGATNPVAIATEGGRNTFQSQEVTANFKGTVNLARSLKLNAQYGMVTYNSKRDIFTRSVKYYHPETGDFWYTSTPVNSLDNRDYRNMYQNLQGTADFDQTLGQHNVHLLAGYSQEWNRYDGFTAQRQAITSDDVPVLNIGTLNQTNSGDATHWALRSVFGRINYNFAERYLFEANVRYDGSSRFAPGHRYGVFPSVSGGWRVAEESFMKFLKPAVNDLKLRASWGKLGNQYVGSGLYPYVASIRDVGTMPLGGQITSAFAQTAMANPLLTWESITMSNVGLDLSLFESQLQLTADAFIKNTDDILLRVTLPDVLGLSEPEQNAGKVQNKGYEFGLTWRDNVGSVDYSLTANYSDVINKVTSLGGVPPTYGDRIRMVGQPIDAFYGLVADRIAQVEDFDFDATTNKYTPKFPVIAGDAANLRPGDIMYKDLDGDGVISLDKDRKVIGNAIPRRTFSLRGDLKWKGIDFSAFLQGVGKADGYIAGSARHALTNESAYPQTVHLDRWTPENTDATYPRLTFQQTHNQRFSTFWLENAAYLRLKNVQLGYTLNPEWTRKWTVDRIRIYASADNLFTSTKYFYGYDPESPVSEGGYYPMVKTVSIGANVTF